MYQRRTFFEYVGRQDLAFLEMAKISKELAITFDKHDFEYLNRFRPENATPPSNDKWSENTWQNIWMNAIMKRYSPMVLSHPEIEHHDITIETQVEDGGDKPSPDAFLSGNTGKGKKRQKRYYFKDVPTFTQSLIAKLEKNYDVDKVNLNNNQGRTAARRAAQKALAHVADSSKPLPALHLNSALKDASKEGRRVRTQDGIDKNALGKHQVIKRDPIPLDDDDRKFLAWFDAHPEYPKLVAFQRRYSGGADGLINDPQASKSVYAGVEPGKLYRMSFKNLPPAQMVPVNADRLKKRLELLRDEWGVDFWRIPLSNASAKGWIEKGVYNPGQGQKGSKEAASFLGKQKMETINDYIAIQDAHLRNPEEVDSPSIPGGVGEDFDQEVPWQDLLRQEARIAARQAIRKQESKKSVDHIMRKLHDYDVDDLVQELWAYLSSEKIVSNSEYAKQAWRIESAFRHGTITIDREWKKTHEGGGKTVDADVDWSVKKDKEGGGEEQSPESSGNIIIDFLRNTEEGQTLPDDTDWEGLAQEFIRAIVKWQDDHRTPVNREPHPNMTVQMMIAKDVLRPYVPTMAAEKPSIMQAKIDRTRAVPDQPEAPEPPQNVGAISYGGKEKPEEDDDEFLRQYRGRRR